MTAENAASSNTTSATQVDLKLEAVVIPVSDVDRAKKFYANLGWRLDADFPFDNGFRVVQFTPPGSGCSVPVRREKSRPPRPAPLTASISSSRTSKPRAINSSLAAQMSAKSSTPPHRFRRAVPKLAAPAATAASRQIASPAPRPTTPVTGSPSPPSAPANPDGNTWLLQEVTTRLPGRVDSATTSFASVTDLASALRRAEAAHGEHEKRIGHADPNWPDWYSSYIIAEQAGKPLPQ